MNRAFRWFSARSVVLLVACAGKAVETSSTNDVAAEARAFMEGLRADLVSRNAAAIAARYHPDGAYWLGNGSKEFLSQDSILKTFEVGLQTAGATDMQWHDLSFEPIGPDAVVIAGRFHWTSADGKSDTLSYSSLLVRHEGALRIRVEDESSSHPTPR